MAYTGTTQIVTFIARKPSLTLERFYKHWSTVHAPIVAPWAEKHGIISYKQHHKSGMIVPNIADGSAPNASRENLPTTPVAYDGFVVWVSKTLQITHEFCGLQHIINRKCPA
jgi:hypothetical protein